MKKDKRGRTKKKTTRLLSLISHLSSSGFTLLEIMIALAIAGTAIIAILQTVNYHAGVAYEHTLYTRMLLLAKEKIGETEIYLQDDKGVFPETDISYETMVREFKDSQQTQDEGIVELKVIVRGHDKEIELSELVTRK
ncbi:MAG: prepilin-type N-terminal cleavage/methylation domain-containing protein [Candidatus Mariimomonas ferrooxydans]